MATKEEVMGEGMRRVHRSFANILEDDRFAYTLRGLIVGFDATCAPFQHPPETRPERFRFSRRRTEMFHVTYIDPDPEKEDAFDQHESRATVKQGIISYRKCSPLHSDICR